MGIRADLQMIERAVKRRWNFDRSLAEQAVQDGLNSTDDRVKVRALAIAVQMEKQNQADEHKVLDIGNQYNRDRLTSLAERLGVTHDPGPDGSDIEGGDSAFDGDEDSDRETDNTTRA